jgi:hypothetical protein
MEIPISRFGALTLESKPLGESTKASTPEVQKSTNLKSELWFFHSGLGIFRGHNQQKVLLLSLLLLLLCTLREGFPREIRAIRGKIRSCTTSRIPLFTLSSSSRENRIEAINHGESDGRQQSCSLVSY